MTPDHFSRCIVTTLAAAVACVHVWAEPAGATKPAQQLELGANVNESLTALRADLLNRSHTTWVRGFLPASEFISGKRSVKSDPGIETLQQCAQAGRKVIVSLKWDFKDAGWHAPAADSQREKECFAWVDALLQEMHGQLSVLSLINEVFVDTLPADMQAAADGSIPMVSFLERLAAHVAEQHPKDPRDQPLPLFCGGFTRLNAPEMQTAPATQVLARWCETDKRIAGVDFHLHQRNYQQFETALEFLRQCAPSKPFIVTEFSLVWNYKAHLADRLDSTATGREFASRHKLAADMTVRGFINQCIAQPVPDATWMEFLHSQAWFDPDFLKRSCDLMESHGVTIATYAFSQRGSGGRRPLRPSSTPWLLNPIFLPFVAVGAKPSDTAVNQPWFNEYLRRQSRSLPAQL